MNMYYIKTTIFFIFNCCLVFILISSIYYRFKPNDFRDHLEEKYKIKIVSYEETLKNIDNVFDGNISINFLIEANKNYHIGIIDRFDDDINSISILDNWMLFFMQFIDPILVKLNLQDDRSNAFSNFESFKYERALGRGFGICSQNSLGLSDLLHRKYKVKSKVVGLDGHVVVEAEAKGKKVILDPTLNVFMPFSIEYAEQNLKKVQKFYKSSAQPKIYNKYDSQGNIYAITYGSANYSSKILRSMMVKYFEVITDVLSILILFYLLIRVQKIRKFLK